MKEPFFDENDPLWRLLERTPKPTLPKDFVSEVLRSVSVLESGLQDVSQPRSHAVETRSSPVWRPLLLGLGSAVACAFLLWMQPAPHTDAPSQAFLHPGDDPLLAAIRSSELTVHDLALVARLDEVLEQEISSLWSETH
ncbi:MAG: hypothetical protein RLZZ244_3070 [Verrucomicrobiota bacterium]|jgi:hypothetical protein